MFLAVEKKKVFRSLGLIATGLVDPWDLPTPVLADAQVRSRAREMCKKHLKCGCVPTDDVLAFLLYLVIAHFPEI